MKTKAFIFSVILGAGLLLSGCIPFHIVRGDGDLVTKEISVGDYSKIKAAKATSVEIVYTQSGDNTPLTVTADRNILDRYDIRVESGELKILPLAEYDDRFMFNPTKFTVTTSSSALSRIDMAGGVVFTADSRLEGEELRIETAGSATVNLNDTVAIGDIKISTAGSATVNAPALEGRSFDCEIAGSGKINAGGNVEKASFDIAGSGKVKAFDLQVEEMGCDISGSGNIEISVSRTIRANIAGSGSIKYKGDPQDIRKDVAGSGSIKKVD
jgi:hypothetical protein